jgi:hypothetical protein
MFIVETTIKERAGVTQDPKHFGPFDTAALAEGFIADHKALGTMFGTEPESRVIKLIDPTLIAAPRRARQRRANTDD